MIVYNNDPYIVFITTSQQGHRSFPEKAPICNAITTPPLRYDCMIYNIMTINISYISSATTGHRSHASGTSRLSKRGNPLPLEWTMTTT